MRVYWGRQAVEIGTQCCHPSKTSKAVICFRNRLHQIIQARFMLSKRVCLQLENHALITCFDAFFKDPIIFVQLY